MKLIESTIVLCAVVAFIAFMLPVFTDHSLTLRRVNGCVESTQHPWGTR